MTDPHWTQDPNHPKWDEPVGYSHAASILAILDSKD